MVQNITNSTPNKWPCVHVIFLNIQLKPHQDDFHMINGGIMQSKLGGARDWHHGAVMIEYWFNI